eukprot:1449574-Lingulodinium_polyedra.AAC.1
MCLGFCGSWIAGLRAVKRDKRCAEGLISRAKQIAKDLRDGRAVGPRVGAVCIGVPRFLSAR